MSRIAGASSQAAKKTLSLLDEFKAFAFKGNVVDLAVGVVIGSAFSGIVKSLVDNIIMPLIGVILPGDKGYEGWTLTLNNKVIPYGKFLGDIVNFVIVALALFFFIVKFLGWIMNQKKAETDATPPLSREEQLLTEIRDLLARRA